MEINITAIPQVSEGTAVCVRVYVYSLHFLAHFLAHLVDGK